MGTFALSERWNGWSNLDVMIEAARAAIAAGPLDPVVCEVTLESDDDTARLPGLDEAEQLLRSGVEPLSMDIYVAHVPESDASVTLMYNGRWLRLDASGGDWQRARQAFDAARVEIAVVAGITTFKLP